MYKDTNQNLKDTQKDTEKDSSLSPVLYGSDGTRILAYSKSQKLVTALYMVTDIMDKDEPIRTKLRNCGVDILSDIQSIKHHEGQAESIMASGRIDATMSFLKIASTMNLISDMNYSILEKEFTKLKAALQEYTSTRNSWLEEFLDTPQIEEVKLGVGGPVSNRTSQNYDQGAIKGHINPKGHTRLGLQNASTLMHALSDKKLARSFVNFSSKVVGSEQPNKNNFDLLKKERRYEITSFIVKNNGSATITDIKNGAKGVLAACGEKTLQRELLSMTKDGVLNKVGEKRWSRYSIASHA